MRGGGGGGPPSASSLTGGKLPGRAHSEYSERSVRGAPSSCLSAPVTPAELRRAAALSDTRCDADVPADACSATRLWRATKGGFCSTGSSTNLPRFQRFFGGASAQPKWGVTSAPGTSNL